MAAEAVRRRTVGSVVALGAAVACACHGADVPEARPVVASASSAPALSASAHGDAPDGALGDRTPAPDAGLPRLSPVLDDARLAAVRELASRHEWGAAGRALDDARNARAGEASVACAWAYVSARLFTLAGEPIQADRSWERAIASGEDGGAPCPLASYATLRSAQTLVRLGRWDDALARARAVGDDVAMRDEAKLALADALAGKGDRAQAVPIWRALLGANTRHARVADVATLLASALLDGADGPAEGHAQEAFDLATRVLVEAPMAAETTAVDSLRDRASKLLAHRMAPPLTSEDRVRQAQAWFDAGQHARARTVTEALLKTMPKRAQDHREVACKAATLRAQAMPRGKPDDAADAWGEAIERCERTDDALAVALYYGGKASASARRFPEALARFARVEKEFPKHRLADDARLHGAGAARDGGDEARYVSMLATLPDAYPDGDMRGEALFRVALVQIDKRDLGGARATLDRLLAIDDADGSRPWATAGRAAYFRARVSQLAGDADDAKNRYAAVVADQPLAFYMLLAHARLHAMDAERARAAVDGASAHEAAGSFLTRERPEFHAAAFARFIALLEVGDVEAARREASGAAWLAEGADPELVWAIATLYDRAGAPDVGHSFARSRLVDYRAHWPAGRWRFAWEAAFPRPWDATVAKESEGAHVPTALTWAIMREESAFNPDARSVANAVGLMQLLGGTARQVARGTPWPADETSLHRPDVSIALGARLLGSLRASFSSNPALAIAAYNGGSGSVRRWLAERGGDDFDVFVERIPFDETRGYVKRVLASEAAYAYLYAPKNLDELLALPARASGDAVAGGP